MRRAADRFCKLTFWPIVETEGELPFWHSSDSNFWCVNDNFDRRDGVELRDVPFSEVLPVHTVFEEPDFTSVWDAREKALLLESSLQLPLFEVDFDCISKWWIKTSESGSHFDGGILNESNDFAAARLYGPPDDAPLGIRHESLHDWLEQPRRHRITRPTSHSGTDDREQPLESASSSGSSASRTRRSQASPRSSPQIPWQRSIWEILIHEGRPDIDGEDAPVIFLSSFYLDHVRHRHHYQARPLRFSLDFDNWEDDIRFMWEDHIDPDLSLAVHLVQPQPPAITGGGSLGTLIVHQNPHEQQVACHISAVIISDPNTRVQESAHSVAPLLPPERALQLGGVDDLCALREKLDTMSVLFTLDFALFRVMNQSKPRMDLASPSEFHRQ